MEKSYARLVSQRGYVADTAAVSAAVENLRRHSGGNSICSRCDNEQESLFQVVSVDATGSVTEVKCKSCKETSCLCHYQCYCRRNPTSNGLERSYKERLSQHTVRLNRKSIYICSVMTSTVTVLRRRNDDNKVCACGNDDQQEIAVTEVDPLGFITSVTCSQCQQPLAFSPLEESYIVQMLYHGQSDETAAIQKALNGDHVEHIREVCDLLRRHSFYADSICPEFDSGDQECCRIVAIDKASDKVTEVEFVMPTYDRLLQITCRSDCYYHHYNSPSQYESTYKTEMRNRLQAAAGETGQRRQTSEARCKKAVLSCTVLTATMSILRRHNIDNKLCRNCNNDDHHFLEVIETDRYGFITRVKCSKCNHSMSTACHHSRFYYEEIDESVTLKRGDHICWHRRLAYWHHAVVTGTSDRTITVAEYGCDKCSVTFRESTKNRQDMSASCLCGTPYRITYNDCYMNEYAALRAEKVVGQKHYGYNPLNRNCEHCSHWCKTGIDKSDQVMTCFSSVAKTALAIVLRLLNMVLLIIFQVVHESREGIQIDRKAFERFEHIITGAYMLLVFLLFLVWSMYTEGSKLKPTHANKCCCDRPPGLACGLSIRIIVRELFAISGPFLLIWFEDRILPQGTSQVRYVIVVIFTLLGIAVGSYAAGALVGTLLEYIVKRCISSCGLTSTQREQNNDHREGETPVREDPENELPFVSTTSTSHDDAPDRMADS